MKNFIVKISALFIFMLTLIVFASVGDDNTLRTKIRYQAEAEGAVLTNVWSRVQSDRKMVIFGGTLGSTQELRTLFSSVTNFVNFVRQVQQIITTPYGNPYPQFFTVGFDPYVIASQSNVVNNVVKKEESEVTNDFKVDPKAIYLQEGESEEGGG